MISFLAKFDIHISEYKYHQFIEFMKFKGSAITLGMAFLLSLTPNYSNLRSTMQLRFLEGQGKADWQREENTKRDLEAARTASLQTEFETNQREFKALFEPEQDEQAELIGEAIGSAFRLKHSMSDPEAKDIYKMLTPEIIANDSSCRNDANITYNGVYIGQDLNIAFNSMACLIFLLNNQNVEHKDMPKFIITALYFSRKRSLQEKSPVSIKPSEIIKLAWYNQWYNDIADGATISELPSLTDGAVFNPELLSKFIDNDFAADIFKEATIEEKLEITQKTYPKLQKLRGAAIKLSSSCVSLNIPSSDCIPKFVDGIDEIHRNDLNKLIAYFKGQGVNSIALTGR